MATAATLAACGVVPDPFYPAFEDHHLSASYVVPAAGRIRVPATSRDLVVQQLELLPAPRAEVFDPDGTRWALYDAGTRVELRGRFRSYTGDGPPLSPCALLPGAAEITVLGTER
ncbi:MAG: hypothetical protein KDE27_15925 [Planctomycetes bacterium]|nr:hypothetical protein [Planctomycetota bacterium]